MPRIILPKERLISRDEKNIVVDLPDEEPQEKKKIDMAAIRQAELILKHLKSDPVKVQRKLRNEWERDFSTVTSKRKK